MTFAGSDEQMHGEGVQDDDRGEAGPMKVCYSLTRDDLAALLRHIHSLHEPLRTRLRPWFYLCLAVVCLVVVLIKCARGLEEDDFGAMLALLGCFACLLRCVYLEPWWLRKREATAMFRDLSERDAVDNLTIELLPEGLVDSSLVSRKLVPWSLVYRIDVTKGHVFLFAVETQSFVVPRWAFPSEEEFKSFVQYARDYLATPEDVKATGH
jgi:hypothetical protein